MDQSESREVKWGEIYYCNLGSGKGHVNLKGSRLVAETLLKHLGK